MRVIDLDLVKKPIGKFTLNKKTYEVYEPTLGILLKHSAGLKEVEKELSQENLTVAQINEIQNNWFIREIKLFVPAFKVEDAEHLTMKDRDAVLSLVFSKEQPPEDESQKKTPKKKPTGKK